MVLMTWFPSGAALLSHHGCALSQVGTHSDMMLDVVRTKQREVIYHSLTIMPIPIHGRL